MRTPGPRRFAYYERLSAEQKRIYRRSDAIGEIPLHDPAPLRVLIDRLRAALESGEQRKVQTAAGRLCRALLADLDAPPIELEVLEARPRGDYGELHGLYTYESDQTPRIQVWMRTAAKQRIVAWKSFLRTLLHELIHHLDLNLLALEDTFHTQGFYRREASLYHQLVVDDSGEPEPPSKGQLRIPGL